MNARPPADHAGHLLVVDDDDRIRNLLKRYLSEHDYRVSLASDASQARTLLAAFEFDLLVLDVMMPGESGFSLTQFVRDISETPVLLLSARGLPEDRIEGLEHGADDYLAKPFEPRELLLRVNALLRRARPDPLHEREVAFGDCVFWVGRGELRRKGELVKLTAGEASLLKVLAKKPGAPISREALAEQTDTPMERSIDVQVTRLRRKIEEDPRAPIYLQTVRGVGYALMTD